MFVSTLFYKHILYSENSVIFEHLIVLTKPNFKLQMQKNLLNKA